MTYQRNRSIPSSQFWKSKSPQRMPSNASVFCANLCTFDCASLDSSHPYLGCDLLGLTSDTRADGEISRVSKAIVGEVAWFRPPDAPWRRPQIPISSQRL